MVKKLFFWSTNIFIFYFLQNLKIIVYPNFFSYLYKMNFLAHLYLSESNAEVMIGNFIGDHIKGRNFTYLPLLVQKGVRLHREIDTFTDSHTIVKKSKRRLHKRYRHYDGVIIDIFYDHFLAKNWSEYSDVPLMEYVKSVYQLMQENIRILPTKTKRMLPYMIKYNWLYNYQFMEQIETVLKGMNQRTDGKSKMDLAIEDLELHYNDFEKDFSCFFEELQVFSFQKLNELLKQP